MQEAGMDFPMPPDALPTYETLLQAIREKGKAQVEEWYYEESQQIKDPGFLAERIREMCQAREAVDKVGDLGEYNNIPYEIDWSLCLQQPRKKANEIYDQVLEVTRKELEQSGGLENKIAALREEAARKYKLIKKGQTVNVTFLRSDKISTTLKGRLMNLSADRLQVGGQFIRRADLPAEIQALFYEDSRQKAMENYVAERREEVDRKFLLLLKQRMEENLPPAMLKNGYVPSLRFGSLKGSLYLLENWIPMKEYGSILQNIIHQRLCKKIDTTRFFTFMKSQGYWFDQTGNAWTSDNAKRFQQELQPYVEKAMDLLHKTNEGWILVGNPDATMGYELLTPFQAFLYETKEVDAHMAATGYQKMDYLQDGNHWENLMEN